MTELVAERLVVRRGSRTLLHEVSATLRPGELVGIIGPNGAGKSTLLRCLAGLVAPDRGAIRVDGQPIASLRGPARARLIGYLPQRFEPAWDYTAGDVVRMGAERGSATAIDASADEPDPILASLTHRRWSGLSGGERARVLLASVVATRPPVLLADEPGASLDIAGRHWLLERLRATARTTAVAIALHELDLAIRYCDRLLVLQAGQVRLEAEALEASRSPLLDEAFGVAFRRIRADRDGAIPLLVAVESANDRRAGSLEPGNS